MSDFLTNLQERSRAFAVRSAANRAAGVERSNYTGGRGFQAPTFQLTDEGELEPTQSGYGFERWWRGRPELSGGLPLDYDWLQLDRPPVVEGSGPIAPLGGRGAKRFGDRQQRRYEAQRRRGMTEAEAQRRQREGVGGAGALAADPYGSREGSPAAPRSHDLTNVQETPRRGAEPVAVERKGALRPGEQFTPERILRLAND